MFWKYCKSSQATNTCTYMMVHHSILNGIKKLSPNVLWKWWKRKNQNFIYWSWKCGKCPCISENAQQATKLWLKHIGYHICSVHCILSYWKWPIHAHAKETNMMGITSPARDTHTHFLSFSCHFTNALYSHIYIFLCLCLW